MASALGMGMMGGGVQQTQDQIGQALATYASAREAKKARKWQKNFYQNRYQWAVNDMRKAGLNPILAAQFGGGGVPAGAVGHAGGGSSSAGSGGSSAVQAHQYDRMVSEQLQNMRADTRKKHQEADLASMNTTAAHAHYRGVQMDNINKAISNVINKATMPSELHKAGVRTSDLGKFMDWTNEIFGPLSTLMNLGIKGASAKMLNNRIRAGQSGTRESVTRRDRQGNTWTHETRTGGN